MVDFVLIHGGAGTAAGWSPVREHLFRLGHESVAMDLPCDDPDAGYEDYARSVVGAASGVESPVVVAHSAGGFIAPLVAESLGARCIILLSAMIPVPGETFEAWWESTGGRGNTYVNNAGIPSGEEGEMAQQGWSESVDRLSEYLTKA